MDLRAKLDGIGLVGERRAGAVLVLAFFGVVYFLVALANPEGLGRAFGGLAACYGLGAFALAAGWFWARWYANGLAWSGVMMGTLAVVMGGWSVATGVYLGTHGVVVLCLKGRKMAEVYDNQAAWRERYRLDEQGALRVRRAVTRAAAALPSLILWALAPRTESGALAVLVVGALGLIGLIRMRSLGVLLCGASGVGAAILAAGASSRAPVVTIAGSSVAVPSPVWLAVIATLALLAVFVPFAVPIARFLRRP